MVIMPVLVTGLVRTMVVKVFAAAARGGGSGRW